MITVAFIVILLMMTQVLTDDPFGCNSRVQTSVFVHTFILGASCIPTGLILPLLVNYVGYKFFLGELKGSFIQLSREELGALDSPVLVGTELLV